MNKNTILVISVVVLMIILGLVWKAGFLNQSNSQLPTSNLKIQVVTSFYPLYFFVSQIASDKATISNLTPAGAEPHDYEPTTQDLTKIEMSDLLILNGGVEAWAEKIKQNLSGTQVKVVVAGDGLLTHNLTESGQTSLDPHIWLNPLLAKQESEKIGQALEQIDPQNGSYYQASLSKFENQLDQLDQEYKSGLKSCKQKDIITSHAAFGYLARQYGLNQIPIDGLSPDEEPSPQKIIEIAQFAKQNEVKYIFFESLVSPKLSQTLASEVGAQTLVLDPLEGLSQDDINSGKNYFTLMRENLKNLKIALECQ